MLEYSREFSVLATHLNYTTAALELNLSQPSLSRHIAELERELGFMLFKRSPVELTPAGKYYLESINSIIETLDSTIKQGREIEQRESPSLSLCGITWNTPYMNAVYGGIAQLREVYPDISLSFYENRSQSIKDSVLKGDAEIGILLDEVTDLPPGYTCEWFMDCPFSAWVRRDNPILTKGAVSFSDLSECYLVCSTNRHLSTWLDGMMTACRKFDIEPRFHLKELNSSSEFLLSLNSDEMLFSSYPGGDSDKINPNLVEIQFLDETCFYSAYLFYRIENENPAVRVFVKACRDASKHPSKT